MAKMFIGDMDSAMSTLFGKMKVEFPDVVNEIVDEEDMITDRLLDAAIIKRGLMPRGTTHSKLNILWQKLKGEAMEDMTTKDIGNLEDTYEIINQPLGKGAYGMVLHGRNQKQAELDMALKLFDASNSRMKLAARREAVIQQWLFDEHGEKQTHPNLLQYHGYFSARYNNKLYEIIKLEYFSGVDLQTGWPYKNELSYHTVLDMGIAVLSALKFLHANGIAHRDVKLANIMYNADMNRIFLIDLGLACFPTNQTVVECDRYKLAGSPLYFSPEIWTLQDLDDENDRARILYSADVWAVGCVLAQLFTRNKLAWWHTHDINILEDNLTNKRRWSRFYLQQQQDMVLLENVYPGLPALVTEMFTLLPTRITLQNALNRIHCLRFPEACVQCHLPAANRCGICQTPYCSIACQGKDWNEGHQQGCLGTLVYDAFGFLIGTSHHVVIQDNTFTSTGLRSSAPIKILSPETMKLLCQAIKKSLPAFHPRTDADRSPGGDMGITRFIYKKMYADPRYVPELVNVLLSIEPTLATSPGGLSIT